MTMSKTSLQSKASSSPSLSRTVRQKKSIYVGHQLHAKTLSTETLVLCCVMTLVSIISQTCPEQFVVVHAFLPVQIPPSKRPYWLSNLRKKPCGNLLEANTRQTLFSTENTPGPILRRTFGIGSGIHCSIPSNNNDTLSTIYERLPNSDLDGNINTSETSLQSCNETVNGVDDVNVMNCQGPVGLINGACNGSTENNKNGVINGAVNGKTEGNSFAKGKGTEYKHQQKNKKKKKKFASPTEVNQWTDVMTSDADSSFRCNKAEELKADLDRLYNAISNMTEEDNENLEKYWDQIMPNVSYLGTENVAKVKEALRVGYYCHNGQMRKSGEPFIIHPVEVSLLLAGLRMDAETVMSGLLHDTVEDTDLTFAQVEGLFGPCVRNIVEGETKVSKLPKLAFSGYADEQAENLRQMFVAMTDDYRIIIVKLADRLHNMRTLRHMKPEKQKKISRETLDIFAPLAHRMGIWQFKSELEDIAFMYLYPAEYKRLNQRLRRYQTKFRETLDKSQTILRQTLVADPTLNDQNIKVEVFGRTKELYSLWHKMEVMSEHDLGHISDVVALRVIIYPNEDENNMEIESDRGVWLCYHILGLVQHLPGFQPVPTKVKDYISFPKPNGYQSLHTSLMLNGQTVEVQIRTAAMHQVAEYGMASHWAYTSEKRGMDDLYNTPWLSSIKEWQEDVVCSRDFVECVRRELLGKRVFVFLRNGKILNLARGATVIDVAFQIHSEVGLNMHGVHINGRPASFSYELKNGDVVSILTGEGTPSTDWMRYAKSRSTRAKLRSYFRKKQLESFVEAGKILLADFLQTRKNLLSELSFLDDDIPTTVDGFGLYLPGGTRYDKLEDLLLQIGKRHDREFLRSVVSKVLKVPQCFLVEADNDQGSLVSDEVCAAVRESRRLAMDAASAVADSLSVSSSNSTQLKNGEAYSPENKSLSAVPDKNGSLIDIRSTKSNLENVAEDQAEVADPDNICKTCLPIRGDEIVGTRPLQTKMAENDFVTVHRRGCVHLERALNRSMILQKQSNLNGENVPKNGYDITSKESDGGNIIENAYETELKNRNNRKRFTRSPTENKQTEEEQEAVNLRWSNSKDDDTARYMTEIRIVANDRQLLLADCSGVVSHSAFILKTGSITKDEHATLNFLVKVKDLDHLQDLMDNLRNIPSVMSVERKLGTDLL